jgi:hypothetical protein
MKECLGGCRTVTWSEYYNIHLFTRSVSYCGVLLSGSPCLPRHITFGMGRRCSLVDVSLCSFFYYFIGLSDFILFVYSLLLHILCILLFTSVPIVSRDVAVGMATGYGLDDRGVRVRVPVESRIFFSPRCPDRFWGPSNLQSNGYRGLFPRW